MATARNEHGEFVGTEEIKRRQREQLAEFRLCEAARDWSRLHGSHFDWWMFPIDRPSQFGFAWTVFESEIAELAADEAWVADYLDGVRIEALAWGWDLAAAAPVPDPEPEQRWQDWPIRLEKLTRSLELFGFTTELRSMCGYFGRLSSEGVSFRYGDRDLADSLSMRCRRASGSR